MNEPDARPLTKRPNYLGDVGWAVAANVRRLRKARRLNQQSVAARLTDVGRPMPASSVSKIESGDRRVDADDLAALARVLHVTPQQLLDAPPSCTRCHGTPPAGFACNACGAGA